MTSDEQRGYTLHAYHPRRITFEALCGVVGDVAVTSARLAETFGVNCPDCLAVIETDGLLA